MKGDGAGFVFLTEATAHGSAQDLIGTFTSPVHFQQVVPVPAPGYANKGTYWQGGAKAPGFHQLPTLPGELVGGDLLSQEPRPQTSRTFQGPPGLSPLKNIFFFFSFQFEWDTFKKCQGGSSADLWVPSQGGCHRERTM